MKKILCLVFAAAIVLLLLGFAGCAKGTSVLEPEPTPLVAPTEAANTQSGGEASNPQDDSAAAEPQDGGGLPYAQDDGVPSDPQGDGRGLTIYFIDVGQGDSALVVSGDAAMLIDGGPAKQSDKIYAFLKKHGISHLDYIVATHAHEDHVGGLAGALNFATVGVCLCPVTEYDSKTFRSFVKYLDKQSVSITIPTAGDTFALGGANVEVIGPVRLTGDANNSSIVLKITYGETSFLFTGDAGRGAEQDILDAGRDISATVLRVGHHGSESSTTYPFLREVMPEYAVISCGKDNPYGHPHEGPLSKLRDAGALLYRTDMQGTVTCVSDGRTVSFAAERNEGAQTNPTDKAR